MFIFAHMGIGSRMISLWNRGLPLRWLLLGCVLPDLVDKPLYYGLSLLTGKKGVELGLVTGSRTLGHTLIFLAIFLLISMVTKKRQIFAISLGIATHLLLDGVADVFLTPLGKEKSAWVALLFPFGQGRFTPMPLGEGIKEHAGAHFNFFTLTCELAGILLLSYEFWRRKLASRGYRSSFRIPNRFGKKP